MLDYRNKTAIVGIGVTDCMKNSGVAVAGGLV